MNDTNLGPVSQAESIPVGMVVVSKEEFFASIGKMDVHPRAEKMWSDWMDQRTLRLMGRTTPGYLCEGDECYMVAESIRTAVTK